jgi:PAS domain S-box-containing protein
MNLPLPHRQSLKTRVTLLSLAIFVSSIWAIGYYASRLLRENMQNQLSGQQYATASILAAQIDRAIAERLASMELIAVEIGPTLAANPSGVQGFLEQRPIFQRMFNADIFVVRRDGVAIANTPRSVGRTGTNYSDRPDIANAMVQDKSIVGRPVISRQRKTPAFVIATPLRDLHGNVVGALVGVTDLGRQNFLDEITKGSYGKTGGYLLVAPQHKLIVTASDKRLIMKEIVARDPLVTRFMEGYEGSGIMVNPFGVEELASARRIPASGWYLSAVLPTEEAFAPIVDTRARLLTVTLVVTLFSGMLVWWMLRGQLAPMLQAVKALATLPESSTGTKSLPIARHDEVGELIAGFNRLLQVLGEREQALQTGERRFRAIIDASPVPLSINDVDGHITFVNQAFTKAIGYTVDDVPTLEAWWPRAYPDEAYRLRMFADWKKLREEAQRNNTAVARMEVNITCKDGEVRNFIVSSSDLEQEFSGTRLVVLYDNTDRKKREETQARLAAIVESSNDAILSRTLDGIIVTWNAGAEKMLGYSAAEIIGRSHAIVLPPGHQLMLDVNNEMVLSGEVFRRESQRLTRDGRVIDVLSSHSAIRDGGGKITGVSIILQDITERKRTEDTRARLAAIVENSNDAIIGCSVPGRIFSWNAMAARLFGFTAEEAIGQNISIIIPPEKEEEVARNRQLRAQSREILDLETVRRTKDGRLVPVSLRVSAILDASGGQVGSSLIFRDITILKQAEAARVALEEQLRESQKMQAIGTLAGGIAHDFNNIIAAILGNAELARQDGATGATGAIAQESLEEIRKAGRRARELVQQILAFSRRQPAERRPMMLSPIVEESTRLLRSTLPARISLEVRQEERLPAVLADPTQMQQVLLNLATNAMQAIGSVPGRIQILLDSVMIDEAMVAEHPALRVLRERSPGRALRLAVNDTGPGMDRMTQKRIFEPFFTTKPVGEGTGLGLSVVHGIVQSHQGVIVVRSQPGMGTGFTVYLPALDTLETATGVTAVKTAVTTPHHGANRHVLYLDDDRFLVMLVKRLLERRGLRVSTFVVQEEALAALRADPGAYDLFVSDYNMPGMSGLDVARIVRDIRPDLPMVVASGFVDEALQAQAREAGVREVLFKAEAMESFCEVVIRLINDSVDRSKPD